MPQLLRTKARLLRRVKDAEHATDADYVQASDEHNGGEGGVGAQEGKGEAQEEAGQKRGAKRRRITRAAVKGASDLLGSGNTKKNLQQQQQGDQQKPTPPLSELALGSQGVVPKVVEQVDDDEADIMRDPLSSESEDEEKGNSTEKENLQPRGPSSMARGKRTFKMPTTFTNSKGTRGSSEKQGKNHEQESKEGEDSCSEAEPFWVRQQAGKKAFDNFHAPRPSLAARGEKRPLVTYSRRAPLGRKNNALKKRELKMRKIEKSTVEEEEEPVRVFVYPRGYQPRTSPGVEASEPDTAARTFRKPQQATLADDDSDSLSPLSSVPSSPGDFLDSSLAFLNSADKTQQDPWVECPMCGKRVERLMKQEFEDEYSHGNHLTFKWQQRFCRHHRRLSAQLRWQELGYPDIDWLGLDSRLAAFQPHLREVLFDQRPSRHREKLRKKVKSGRKTAMQTFMADDEDGGGFESTLAGYYGPRGEEIMIEHIFTHLVDDIREQAEKDRLIAAPGVCGGVVGFVQFVLMPELAEQLIMQDLRINEVEVVRVLRNSAEMGELLNPEVCERIERKEEEEVNEYW